MKLFCVFLTIFLKIYIVFCYNPVVIFHGILSGAESMVFLAREIDKAHPGTKIYICDKFSGWNSLEGAWRQINEIRNYLINIGEIHPEGFNIIGYSQGGLLARAAIQIIPNHNVKTFISLSSPQAGQYGTDFLHLIFPNLAAKTAYELFYSKVGQYTSVGGYWNDPYKHELYLKYNVFLPLINNEINSSNSSIYRKSIMRLSRMVLIGGPDDGVITPWESSHFGYYNESLNVVPYNKRSIYTQDLIGLKELEATGRLFIIVKPFVHHLTWHKNRKIINELILPFLD